MKIGGWNSKRYLKQQLFVLLDTNYRTLNPVHIKVATLLVKIVETNETF